MLTTPESAPDSTSSTLRSVGSGGVAGLGAALFGYLVTYLLISSTIENSTTSQVFEALGSDVSTWRVVGRMLMSAHGVVTRFPGLSGTTSSANFIEDIEAFSPVLYAVPMVTLLAAGVFTTVTGGASLTRGGAPAGMRTMVGYLVSTLAGVTLFTVSVDDVAVNPDPVVSVLLVGATYSAALGTVGGVAAIAFR